MTISAKLLILLISVSSFASMVNAQKSVFNTAQNVGNPKISGRMIYHPDNQSYELSGAGSNMWFDKDEFFFAARQVSTDFILTSRVEILTPTGDAHRKIGLMIRQNMDTDSPYADIILHADGLLSLQYRTKKGGITEEIRFTEQHAQYLQLEKKGNKILARIAQAGKALSSSKEIELQFESPYWVGMVACSHHADQIVSGLFSNVRFDIPAADGVDGYKNQSASRLEILDVESGDRKVIYATDKHIEAPNWSRDGKFLIYNSGGKLHKFDLEKGTSSEIYTGRAVNNNNDHGISFDGKILAISNHTSENGKSNSIIYTLPVDGGEPFRVTEKGPSYWHGWSPDGQLLVYCAERNGDYNVYQIPAKGGQEKQLTTAAGLDDGPEYSPDGKHIYFNSTRTGTMQIWRMKPDGSDQEQVTFDQYNDWFAHPSPDGKSLIYISYSPEVPATSHPHNQRVMLRMQPTSGKEVKVLAHIYGGQGTFNVPSWSPDSKKVAFVSYTYGDSE